MTAESSFFSERDRRTGEYQQIELDHLNIVVTVIIGRDAALNRPGQVAALALINMLARVHHRLRIMTAPADLKAHAIAPGADFLGSLYRTALEISPLLDLEIIERDEPGGISVGIATDPTRVHLGWEGGRGCIEVNSQLVGPDDRDLIGAATASCLAAAAIMRLLHGLQIRPSRLNLVERTADAQAGTTTVNGMVQVGNVVVAGAGAVTHGLLYWLAEIGVAGAWVIVDRDTAELHNTNRCLGMTAAHAGWPGGTSSGVAEKKAVIAARMIGATARTHWLEGGDLDPRPDLLLVLANEGGVRGMVATLGYPVLLHASTSSNWTAELHRHLGDRDDCPACRLPNAEPIRLLCSTGPSNPMSAQASSTDAALPFLSATAGLMLAIALLQLPNPAAELTSGLVNHWSVHCDLGARILSSHRFPPGRCPHVLPFIVRKTIQRQLPSLWDDLDCPVPINTAQNSPELPI